MKDINSKEQTCDWCQDSLTRLDMIKQESLCLKCRTWIENNSGKDETVGKPMTKQVCENYLECGGYANMYTGDALHCDKCNDQMRNKHKTKDSKTKEKDLKEFIKGLRMALSVK